MKPMKIDRIWHPCQLWEEIPAGMWSSHPNPKKALQMAVEFTGNARLYGDWMNKVAREWKYSCENALTDGNLNHRAWIGHAAVAFAIGVPEDITRKAWGMLSERQRKEANAQATAAIQVWWRNRGEDCGILEHMEKSLLL